MPDLPTRLARKWCRQHGEWPVEGFNGCDERIIIAAIREALKEAEKVAQDLTTHAAETDEGGKFPEASTCGAIVYGLEIARRIAALREGE